MEVITHQLQSKPMICNVLIEKNIDFAIFLLISSLSIFSNININNSQHNLIDNHLQFLVHETSK